MDGPHKNLVRFHNGTFGAKIAEPFLAIPGSGRSYVVNVLSQKIRIFSTDSGFFRIFFQSKPGECHGDSGKPNFIKIC